VASDGMSIVSKICHIEAASKEGPRWNSGMTDDDRRHYKNLILLCDEHHVIIDNKENEVRYKRELLWEWKMLHVEKMSALLNKETALQKAIFAISNLDNLGDPVSGDHTTPFDPEQKILHNNIIRNRYIIDEYKVYYTKVNAIYQELEKKGSFRKEKLLRNVNNAYLRVHRNYADGSADKMKAIRENADDIFEAVEELLFNKLKASSSRIDDDELTYGLSIIMVDAFMRCKILENPPKSS
jgi:hypothetical protein